MEEANHVPRGRSRLMSISRRWGWARHLRSTCGDGGPWNTVRKWTSGTSCGRKDSVKQMMSGLSAVAWIERSVRLKRRPRLFEVHTARDRRREVLLVGCRNVESEWGNFERRRSSEVRGKGKVERGYGEA